MIYRARYILPVQGSPIEDGELRISEGRIAAIGCHLSANSPDEQVCDLGNAALMPGFVNAHTHLDYTFARPSRDGLNLWNWIERVGFGLERTPDYDTLLASAALGAAECALCGVTCVGDSSFSGAAAQAVDDVGLRGVVCKEIFGMNTDEDSDRHFARTIDELRQKQSSLSSRVRLGVSPHSVYTSDRRLLELCADERLSNGLPVALHLAETRAEAQCLTAGTGPLAEMRRRLGRQLMTAGVRPARYLGDIGLLRPGVCLAHCVDLDEEEIRLVSESGAGVAHCPRSNAFLGSGVAPLPALIAAGARVGIGTDSPASSLSLSFFEEIRFALAVHRAVAEDAAVLTAKDVLRQATLGGAEALGLDREIGSLEVGKRADLVALDLSGMWPGEDIHLALAAMSPQDVLLVLVDGERVAGGGTLARVDRAECRKRMESALGR